jgi:hypothetical protein
MKTVVDQPMGIQWILTSKLEDLDFADDHDIGLISHSCAHIQVNNNRQNQISRGTGLETNISKTKCLRTNHTITINDQSIEDVERFTYMGSIVSKTGGTDEDVKARISIARLTFVMLKPCSLRKTTSVTTPNWGSLTPMSYLCYGLETWKRTKNLGNKLQVFINTYLCQILPIRWPERFSKQELWQQTEQEPITNQSREENGIGLVTHGTVIIGKP